jgi:hypothetical protein
MSVGLCAACFVDGGPGMAVHGVRQWDAGGHGPDLPTGRGWLLGYERVGC